MKHSKDENFNKIFTILYSLSRDLDLFGSYGVDKVLECRIVSVGDEARGHGLAKELMRRSIEVAIENGFKLFKVDTTGVYSHKICSSLGLKAVRELRYDEYLNEEGLQIFKVEPPHEVLTIMVLDTDEYKTEYE